MCHVWLGQWSVVGWALYDSPLYSGVVGFVGYSSDIISEKHEWVDYSFLR